MLLTDAANLGFYLHATRRLLSIPAAFAAPAPLLLTVTQPKQLLQRHTAKACNRPLIALLATATFCHQSFLVWHAAHITKVTDVQLSIVLCSTVVGSVWTALLTWSAAILLQDLGINLPGCGKSGKLPCLVSWKKNLHSDNLSVSSRVSRTRFAYI